MTRLSIAIPSKGRLKEKTEEWLEQHGFAVRQIGGERGYQAEIEGLGDVEMRLISAREIASSLRRPTVPVRAPMAPPRAHR